MAIGFLPTAGDWTLPRKSAPDKAFGRRRCFARPLQGNAYDGSVETDERRITWLKISSREDGTLLGPAAEQERAIRTAKTEGIRHGVLDFSFAGVIRNQIHPRRIGIRIFQVDGRRQYLMA